MNSKINKLRLLLWTILQVLVFSLSYALDTPDLRIINAGLGKQIAIKVAGLPRAEASFELRTKSGQILLKQSIYTTEYQALFSLEHLSEGYYTIVLNTVNQEIVQPIRITQRAVRYKLEQREFIVKPAIALSGRQLDVDLDNPLKHEVRISLRDKDGQILHAQTVADRSEVELRMNLLRVPEGDYRVVVEAGGRSWSETIKL